MKTHLYKKDILKICGTWHLTAWEIFKKIAILSPAVSQSSIYRNIDDMVKKWELNKVEWVWKKSYFEKNTWNHIHLIDNKSWKIHDLKNVDIDIPDLPEGFKVKNFDIKVFWEFKN